MDYLRQGVNESIDNYIERMETLVRKMGANAPNEDTLKRRFIAGLRDPSAQQHISLSRPATLVASKDVARVWEEVQLGQQQRQELLFEPMIGTSVGPTNGTTQANPAATPPTFMAATNTPQEVKPVLTEEQIIKIVAQAVKAATLTHEAYGVRQEVAPEPNQGVFRSNIFCAKCQGYGHMATECPTVSRLYVETRIFCNFCKRNNHTEDECRDKGRWRTGPPECWRCGCLGHIQAHCPNARKQEDFSPMCQYCSREGHYDVDCPQRRNDYGEGQRGVDTVPNTGVVIRELDPGDSTSTHHVEANQGKEKGKEPMVAVVTRAQEYTRGNVVQVNDEDETHRQRDLDGGRGGERLKVQEKLPKKKQAEEGTDIVQRLVETEVTLDLATLLRCSPTCRKQFYNEFIKKPRKARRKEKVVEVVLGTIQSITTQVDSNAPAVTVEINGYAVPGVQLDSGAAVNLMTEYMMKALGLTQLEHTPMSLRMADQTQVKPARLIRNVQTIVGGIEFSVDYLVVRPRSIETTFSILLGRPWLMQADCVHDWRRGFITIGPKTDRIQMQVTPMEDAKKTAPIKELEKKVAENEKITKACCKTDLTYKQLGEANRRWASIRTQ
ncbi:hypothetical protein KP509_25G012500 [Ceratopteris richardii]|uniref:CCHC-type domain-containing protein n=1 Tax=Ceratopteris richardii TaxID=49495 RepID=A0A8T2RQ28_CERRI|nr:hypothetical protein KP509_25G012500 [Ceratopteris richardii]